ncbi:MAG: Carbohydrate kinase [Acidobacteriaceae bacterium]|jgi:fructokinase|nr:Carbohydrate kinase [Acidobacteriaceae bacterium]
MKQPTVIGLGEILWDLLPSGRQLGGAPANFAYCSHLLGDRAIVASRVGRDQLGQDIRESLSNAGIADQYVQSDSSQPTGTVQVQLDPAGQPKFQITEPAAWDFLEWTEDWHALAKSADAVCFGSLAQRSAKSRSTILEFLAATRSDALRIFDVNLRQGFYSPDVVCESLKRANAVKLNHEEVPRVRELLKMNDAGDGSFCRGLIGRFDMRLICITRGANGSMLCDKHTTREHPGFRVRVNDTIGAGDAFTAALVHEYLRERPLAEMNESANRMGAWVATHSGAMPQAPATGLKEALEDLG